MFIRHSEVHHKDNKNYWLNLHHLPPKESMRTSHVAHMFTPKNVLFTWPRKKNSATDEICRWPLKIGVDAKCAEQNTNRKTTIMASTTTKPILVHLYQARKIKEEKKNPLKNAAHLPNGIPSPQDIEHEKTKHPHLATSHLNTSEAKSNQFSLIVQSSGNN